ncbi:MAG TPA: ABC-F family ATP-binding cassette domain-containing protein [Hyphomonadaceae bacterium]|nr:ABC-F family ATP-binding cassette domain-containing protein [Hyphomonadaceae bacterium]
MLSVSNLTKAYGGQTLFEGVSLQFNAESRYGLVGANGSGKSTLLKIIAGDELANDGTISLPKRAKVGVLKQDHFRYENVPIIDVVMMGNQNLWHAMTQKELLLASAESHFDADKYAELEEVILTHDGYTMESQAAEILEGLGIPTEVHRAPLSTLSGGFKLRVLLAQTLAAKPDLLLLDEPTNHLDILSIRWLEKFLLAFKGCAIVVSHDHRFLDNVCTHIVDVDYETAILYKGNYSEFTVQKVENRERKEAEIEKREKEIAHHQAFIDAFKAKATKARQAGSKQKLIDRIVLERLPQTSRRYPVFKFEQRRASGKEVLKVEKVAKAYGKKQVLEGIDLQVRRGDRMAIIGPNGIGKSTLLKIAMREVEADKGTAEWGYETWPGYFAQDHHEVIKAGEQTVEAWLWDVCPREPIGFVRGKLGMVLFTGDDADKKVSSLSGGEAARLVFARLSVEKPNVLVLDEPTNHLDIEAIEALVEALVKYDGTLIFVSHDRWFVQQLANRIVEITPDGLRDFEGTYEEYLERLGDDHLDADAVLLKAKREKKAAKERAVVRETRSDADTQRIRKQLVTKRDKLTAEIEKAESRVHAINELFCDPTFFDRTPRGDVSKLEGEQKTLNGKIEGWMAEWEKTEAEIGELG